MTTIEYLAHDFATFYAGNPWFGDNFKDVVGDLTPDEALAEPPNGHSIARLLWHMVKWRKALAERLLGNADFKADMSDADNWRAEETLLHKDWDEALHQFEALQGVIVAELRLRNEAFLETEFAPGRDYRSLAFGVIQHDIYHLGQIAIVKSLIRKNGLWT